MSGKSRPLAAAKISALFLVTVAAALALAVLATRGQAPTSPFAEVAAGAPGNDDIPDPGAPPGQIRAGTTKGVSGARPQTRIVADRLLVRFEHGTPQTVIDAALARAGVAPGVPIRGTEAQTVRVTPARRAAALDVLASLPAVEYAENDVLLDVLDTTPNDARWQSQWGPKKVLAPAAWDTARGSEGVVVAILDTGVDFDHADLRGAAVPGYDFVNGDANPADDQGHGTAAAGVVAARTNNSLGLAGLCWKCSLMPVKVLDANGSGSTSTIARGIVWASDHGARVINLSLGGPSSTQTLADAVAYAAGKGVFLVAAAGNNGSATPFYPAAYPAVMSVAGTDSADRRYSWSNYGSWVQVAAPGCNVAPIRGGGYGDFCGTSSATPVVSGLIGLVLSAKPAATRVELEHALTAGTSPIGSAVKYGRVDARATLGAIGAPAASVPGQAPAAATFDGRITLRHPKKVFHRSVAAGNIATLLSFSGAPRLTVSIINSSGRTIRRVAGSSPVRANVTVKAGTFSFVVQGSEVRSAPFSLRVTYPGP